MRVLGFTWDQVDLEAHRLEHSISAAFEDRMDRLCDFPTHCPHGDPIPQKDGTLPQESLLSLTEMSPGQQGVLRRVGSNDARVLRYLSQLDLQPGQALRLVDVAPFNGPVTFELLASDCDPQPTHMLGSELAAKLYIYLEPANESN